MYFPLFIFLAGRSEVLLVPGLFAGAAIDFLFDVLVELSPPLSSIVRPAELSS